jgi:threonine/homoserine/homoserine lactone efflux protein
VPDALAVQIDATYAAYLIFTLLFVATPGAATAVVVRQALEGGRRAGLAAALGAGLANCTHATLAGIGLSFLITTFPASVRVIRILGAAYLAWLCVMSFRRAWGKGEADRVCFPGEGPSENRPDLFFPSLRDGAAVNMLNPSVISFYVAVVPSFVPDPAAHVRFVLLAFTHVSLALTFHSLWALAFAAMRRWVAGDRSRRLLDAVFGILLAVLALGVLVEGG